MHLKLKIFIAFVFIFLSAKNNDLHAQFLKNILNSVKQTAQNKADQKANNATNKALDKVDSLGKKKPATNNSNNNSTTTSTTKSSSSNNNNNATPQNNEYNSDGSFIKLNLSSNRIIAGGAVQVSGSSIKYKN